MIDQRQNEKTQNIIRWRKALSTMEDEQFFYIIKTYLGEIHTPYNKDNLIEQLSSIFRKEESKKTILAYLSESDKKIITAISKIKNCTKQNLFDFFKQEFSISELFSNLINLTERLIIYSYIDVPSNKMVIDLNPLLTETLESVIDSSFLTPLPVLAEHNYDDSFCLSPDFIAAFYSYILENPDLCKNTLEIRKKNVDQLSLIFTNNSEYLEKLLISFINLGLIKAEEKKLSADTEKFKKFSELDELAQYAYIASSSVVRLSRSGLQSQTQLLLDTIFSIPKEGLSLSSVFKIAFLIKHKSEEVPSGLSVSRFSRMLDSYRNTSTENITEDVIDSILKNALSFGLLKEIGKDENGEAVVVPGKIFEKYSENALAVQSKEKKGILNINAGTSVVILSGLSLGELLPLVDFLSIKSFNVVSEYEISKTSILRAFSKGYTAQRITELLLQYSAYSLPQNLIMNIEEWNNSYNSAILYKGYVLKVDEKKQRIIEKSKILSSLIAKKLADGIFLLNIPENQDPSDFLKGNALEISFETENFKTEKEVLDFPKVETNQKYVPTFFISTPKSQNTETSDYAEKIKDEFLSYLETLNLTDQQKECLTSRIKRNIILSKDQIKAENVRTEILEADGVNFPAKVHLIDNAIEHSDMVEITLQNEENPKKLDIFLGKPISLVKQTNDSILKMQIDDSEETKIFSVSRINHVKILKRTTLFV